MDILKLVYDYDVVTIFRHQGADQDALGSQFGLQLFLKEKYPDKKIYALGDDVGSKAHLFPAIDHVSNEVIASSIAIVLDCANAERIDDSRYAIAKKIVKIDHHIVVQDYADISYVDTHAAATCEILAHLFMDSNIMVSKQCATYLYYGLIADCLSFTTNSTTSKTLKAAAYLLDCGVNVTEVKAATAGMSEKEFLYMNEIRNKIKVHGKVAYSIMNREDYIKYELTYNEAKEKVFALENVNEYEIWCLFTQMEDGTYSGSLRSRFIPINEVANQFHGGGHRNACGVKKLTLDVIAQLVEALNKI